MLSITAAMDIALNKINGEFRQKTTRNARGFLLSGEYSARRVVEPSGIWVALNSENASVRSGGTIFCVLYEGFANTGT